MTKQSEAKKLKDALDKAHAALFEAQRLLGWDSERALEVGAERVRVYKLWKSCDTMEA